MCYCHVSVSIQNQFWDTKFWILYTRHTENSWEDLWLFFESERSPKHNFFRKHYSRRSDHIFPSLHGLRSPPPPNIPQSCPQWRFCLDAGDTITADQLSTHTHARSGDLLTPLRVRRHQETSSAFLQQFKSLFLNTQFLTYLSFTPSENNLFLIFILDCIFWINMTCVKRNLHKYIPPYADRKLSNNARHANTKTPIYLTKCNLFNIASICVQRYKNECIKNVEIHKIFEHTIPVGFISGLTLLNCEDPARTAQ